jgi:hypothetical protein
MDLNVNIIKSPGAMVNVYRMPPPRRNINWDMVYSSLFKLAYKVRRAGGSRDDYNTQAEPVWNSCDDHMKHYGYTRNAKNLNWEKFCTKRNWAWDHAGESLHRAALNGLLEKRAKYKAEVIEPALAAACQKQEEEHAALTAAHLLQNEELTKKLWAEME